jgi:hypothetical protein
MLAVELTWSPPTTLLKLTAPGVTLDPYTELADAIEAPVNASGVMLIELPVVLSAV